ncbi:histidine triad (HIT) protein [Streptomyces goshikiensis]|uniref:histidine triad (HIT) protein n=1 Tax=Streptomyces goshikiensis TaxID=1942 RepID=UPI00365CFCFE
MAGIGCPMCGNEFDAADTGWGILLRHGEVASAYLRRSGPVRGRGVLIHRGGHAAAPTRLPEPEAAAFWRGTVALGRAIGALYQPTKINCLTLGNKIPHLRTHVFSRRVAAGPGRASPLRDPR